MRRRDCLRAAGIASALMPGAWRPVRGGEVARKPMPDVVVLMPRITGSVLQKDGRDGWAHLAAVIDCHDREVIGYEFALQARAKEAGVAGRLLHDFRRTAVPNLERAGVPRSVAMAMVGHRTEAICHRYAIVAESDLKAGAERLAALHATQADEPRTVLPLAEGAGARRRTEHGQLGDPVAGSAKAVMAKPSKLRQKSGGQSLNRTGDTGSFRPGSNAASPSATSGHRNEHGYLSRPPGVDH
jgi:hypothetical protein